MAIQTLGRSGRTTVLRIVDVRTRAHRDFPIPIGASLSSGTWSPDSRRIAFVPQEGRTLLVDVRTGGRTMQARRGRRLVAWTSPNRQFWLRGPDADHLDQVWAWTGSGPGRQIFRLPPGTAITGFDVR
jgi:hypothetical protein